MDIAKMSAMLAIKEGDKEMPCAAEQVVERSIKIAELLFAAMKAREWTELVPALDELRLDEKTTMGFSEKAA